MRRHLTVRNRKRRVVVRERREIARDEVGAGHRADRLEQARVSHADPRAAVSRSAGFVPCRSAILLLVRRWPATAEDLIREQDELARASPSPWTPSADFSIGGCFFCSARGKAGPGAAGDPAWAGAAVLRSARVEASAVVAGEAGAPYEAGLLALREGPLLEAAIGSLGERLDVLLVDATGRDHPRCAGLALQLGAILDVPTVGVTHRCLLAKGEWPQDERGARSPLRIGDEIVGYWLRTKAGTRPLAVHAAWRTGPEVAVEVVLASAGAQRTPPPLREARRLARTARSGS